MLDIAKTGPNDELTRRLHLLVGNRKPLPGRPYWNISPSSTRGGFNGPKGQPSCFVYCTKVLGYSEGAAYKRITAGAMGSRLPCHPCVHSVGEDYAAGSPHAGTPSYGGEPERLLGMAEGTTRLEIERMVAH